MATLLAAPSALACAPSANSHGWSFAKSAQRTSGAYVEELVSGNRVRFVYGVFAPDGTDGSYQFDDRQGDIYNLDGYPFYSDGSRCVNDAHPHMTCMWSMADSSS